MTEQERTILQPLDRAVQSPKLLAHIQPVVSRLREELAKSNAPMAWEPISLGVFDSRLPSEIKSAWIFTLRAGTNTGAERHPNSHQRMMSFHGTGDLQTREEGDAVWISNVLSSDSTAPLEQRWISIPPNVWHQPVIAPEQDWVVVSFHTVPAEELIEERPDPDGHTGTRQMRYLDRR